MIADRFGAALLAVMVILGVYWGGGTVAAGALVPPGPARRLERAGWGFALGFAVLATGLAAGYTLAFGAPVIGSLLLLAATVWLGWRFRLPPSPSAQRAASALWQTVLGTGLVLILVWGFVAFLLRALTEPMVSNDYFAIWGLKGKTFFAEQAIPRRLFDWSSFEFSNPGYPLGLPLLYAGFASLIGAWEDHALALLFPCWMAATVMVLYGWLRRRGASALTALAAAALLAHFGALYSAHLTGMAEIPMAFAFLLAATAVSDAFDGSDARVYGRVALASWIAASTKNEGLFFVGTALALLAVLALARKAPSPARTAVALVLPAAISSVLHRLAIGSHPVRGVDLAYLTHPDLGARFLEGLAATWRIHLHQALWPAVAVLVLIAVGSRTAHGDRLLLLAGASAAVYLALPALCPYGPVWLATWTVGRALLALAPLVAAGVAARWGRYEGGGAATTQHTAAALSLLLLLLLLAANRPKELRRRLGHLAHYASRPLEVRRLGGSATAFDRRFYFFLESARRKLPAGARGVAVFAPESEQARNLVAYQFAPLPAVVRPRPIPAGWIAAVYGPVRPPGWKHVADVSDGALMWPAP